MSWQTNQINHENEKLIKAGKLKNNHHQATVLKLDSDILVGSADGNWETDPYSLETCRLKDQKFTCVTIDSDFDNYNYFDAHNYRHSTFYAVDDEYENCS